MTTEILLHCNVDKGLEREGYVKHGLQKVQSILLPENLYYLECGCIYKLNLEKNKFELIRPHVQRCAKCGVDVDEKVIVKNGNEVWCIKCGEGKMGLIENYRHKFVPIFITGYETRWKEINDEAKRRRDRNRNKPETGGA